jgi:hypothetical protein
MGSNNRLIKIAQQRLFSANDLLLVPVLYSIFVLDFKIVKWSGRSLAAAAHGTSSPRGELNEEEPQV